MDEEEPGVIEFWIGVCVVLVFVAWMALFGLVVAALAKESEPAESLTEGACQARIEGYLREAQGVALQFDPDTRAWSLNGVSGETRTLQWLRAEFDLVQVYYRRAGREWDGTPFQWDGQEMDSVWVAYGARTPDGHYISSGGKYPFSRSKAAQGISPGRYRVTVSASGPFVTEGGIDCIRQELTPLCQVETSFLPGAGQVFIESGHAKRDPLNGFLFWAVEVEERLNLCQAGDFWIGPP